MARLNITISDDLKARLVEVEHSGAPFNFSKICGAALEAAVTEAVTKGGQSKLDRIAARMRATRTANHAELKSIGFDHGTAWAELRADPHQLKRLADLVASDEWPTFFGPRPGFPSCVRLSWILSPERNKDLIASSLFWAEIRSLDPSRAYLDFIMYDPYTQAFIDGALSVWEQVRPLLPAII